MGSKAVTWDWDLIEASEPQDGVFATVPETAHEEEDAESDASSH
jgi:hypothetical protein